MCGIAGFLDLASATDAGTAERLARAMGDALLHRGPDDGGVWTDAAAGVGLAHRRLSIVDLSPAGHQPMTSADGRFVIVYNGEVYNADEVGRDLGRPFRGHSDTEVIVEACAAWGVRAAIPRFIGMFAIALYDRAERRLWLIRDRLGIKPLYWAQFGTTVLFGSELKALRAHPAFDGTIDRTALAAYLRTGCVPAPGSIYQGVHKLEAGCWLAVDASGPQAPERFWDLGRVIEAGAAARRRPLAADAVDQLEALLFDAVKRRLVADVPLGAFLSGGIDSSAVAALMQTASRRAVKTYSIGFAEAGYDEAPQARAVAAHLGTDHTEFYVTPADALAVVPELPALYDEPFADSSQIPTLLISRLARGHVAVALSGDGGDEVFAGYNRYRFAHRLWRRLDRVPAPARRAAAAVLAAPSPARWDRLLQPLIRRGLGQPGDKLHKMAAVLALPDGDAVYRRLVSHWTETDRLVLGAAPPPDVIPAGRLPAGLDAVERMQGLDLLTYLCDDVLTKVDRASMAVALEVRVPLLDHRVVEHAWTLPPSSKFHGGAGKWMLRQVLYRHVPPALVERPKMGFGVPIDSWLRGPLRDWAEDLLAPGRMAAEGYLDPAPVQEKWRQHLSGRHNWQHHLWDVLMFQAWLRHRG